MTPIATLPHGSILRYGKTAIATLQEDIQLNSTGLSLLVGLNGEGKTTFLRWLSSLLDANVAPVKAKQVIYLPENLEWPGNLTYRQLQAAMAPSVPVSKDWAKVLGLDDKKKYGLLSKGNRQKVRILLTEALAIQHGSGILCLDEPLSGLDYKTRETIWRGWHGDLGWSTAHRIVSMHPSDIPYNPDQIILVSQGKITLMPFTGDVSWSEIKKKLQP